MAWRTGLVSTGTFLVLSANTLICSAYLSLQTTASYGLTVNIVGMLTYVSMIIVQIKLPLANQLRVSGDSWQIAELWIDRTRLAILVYLAGSLLLLAYGNTFMQLCGAKTPLLSRGPKCFHCF